MVEYALGLVVVFGSGMIAASKIDVRKGFGRVSRDAPTERSNVDATSMLKVDWSRIWLSYFHISSSGGGCSIRP